MTLSKVGFALICMSCCQAALAAADADGSAVTSYAGYAQVIDVEPIVAREMSSVPIKRCTWERLPSRVRSYPGYEPRRVTERRAKRCRNTYESRITESITGYHVTLRYNGVTFSRRTAAHPGKRMPVALEISPLHHPPR